MQREPDTPVPDESERKFADFARATGDWFWESDAEGRITWISCGVESLLGSPAASNLGKTRLELAGLADAPLSPEWQAHLAEMAARRPFRDFRYRRPSALGERWVSTSGVPVFDPQGRFQGYRGVGADITDRKVEEMRVHKTNDQLIAALERSNESVLLCDPEDRIVFANQRFRESIPGLEHLVAPGTPYLTYIRGAVEAGYFPEAAGREEAWVHERMAQRHAEEGKVSRHLRGDRCWQVSDRRLPDGSTISTTLDITEWKHAEDELRASQRLLERVIDAIPMSIFAKDLDSNYVMVNQYMADFFGATKEALLRHHTSQLPSQDETRQQSLRDDQWVYGNRQPLVHETTIQKPDGTPVPYHSSKIPLFDAEGALTGLLGINRDITEQRQAQRRIEEANATLEDRVRERTAQLEAANSELEAFSYSVSHDLKAPLRAIDGAVGLLRMKHGDRIPAEADAYLSRISLSVHRMASLIEGLLEFARLSRKALNRVEVDPGGIIRPLLEGHDESVRQRGAVIRVEPMPPCHADPFLLTQVFENLVSNALKYSTGSRPPRVDIGSSALNGEVEYYVRDNGVGFDMAYAHKLFGVFERLHEPGKFEGTGIGLALVRRIVERHGGRVRAESAPGGGATFYFTIGRPG